MTLSTFPSLDNSARILRASLDLEDVNIDSLFGESIKLALIEHKPLRPILEMIQFQATQNRQAVAAVVGEEVLRNIEKIIL
jgi:hypothetical protein